MLDVAGARGRQDGAGPVGATAHGEHLEALGLGRGAARRVLAHRGRLDLAQGRAGEDLAARGGVGLGPADLGGITDDALALKGLAGIANARLAYELFEQRFAEKRAQDLVSAGANLQRPLWASTGVKDPALPDTLYVTELVAPGTVNTMPEKTLQATFDHGVIAGDTVTGTYAASHQVFDDLAAAGVDLEDVTQLLEDEGVDKFIASWHELQQTVATALDAAAENDR